MQRDVYKRQLVNMLKDEEYRKKLHEAVDGEEMARILEQYEYLSLIHISLLLEGTFYNYKL